jgi:excinuclease UvrABC nuclease subunit
MKKKTLDWLDALSESTAFRVRSKKSKRRFELEAINDVSCETVGIFVLLGQNGSMNYVAASLDLRRRLRKHFRDGDIPAAYFEVWKTSNIKRARRLAKSLIDEYEPYYNG